MAVSTIRSKNNPFVSFLPYLIGIIGMGLVVFFGILVVKNLDNVKSKALLEADSSYGTAEVLVNNIRIGQTPMSPTEVDTGENKITIKNTDRQYETTINFIPNTQEVMYSVGIFRDLGVSDYFSSGRDFWFEKDKSGNVLRVVSEPSGATVYIDNVEQGKTPFSSDKLSEGEYTLRLDAPGYEYQDARINVSKGYVLNLKVKLFPAPVPSTVKNLPDAKGFYDLATSNTNLISDTQNWAKAVIYWNTTRGINLEGVGTNKEPVFDYYLDYKGNLYDKTGTALVKTEEYSTLKDAKNGAYLGRAGDPQGLTAEAKETYKKLDEIGLGGKKATILETGNGTAGTPGWLRVRDAASIGGVEIARVSVGQEYPVLEESTGWVKIRVSDTVQGWVSSTYVKVTE
ncbi:PEGA domain-containing protein [candidate division WWE3 bacterium]|uniref:PEGA domain-containing protein n=1 Tax=candidate division WWE3 bacterium TaxID=2053526 RepID=A0A7X9DKY3_UNCKA|nr:PEGA domain-containing protein [candidate division WWE3 bacterium]